MSTYLPRIVDDIIKLRLSTIGALLIEGPKWCGKTMTAINLTESQLFMQDPDNQSSYLKAADIKPSLLLEGAKPRLLDEWQVAPVLWDAVRFNVDQSGLKNQFILTGSAVPIDGATMHTGTGRIARLTMRPMSLFESNESSGDISLADLFNRVDDIATISKLTIEHLAFSLVRGGWPASVQDRSEQAFQYARDYVDAIINRDINLVDDVTKSPHRVQSLMRSLSRNISTIASLKTISDDISAGGNDELSTKTVSQYIHSLKRIFVVEDLPAWNPKLRLKTAIRTSDKRHFVDPSIAAATLRLTPKKLLTDFEYFGFLFESLCVRDLRVYAESIDGTLYHYRDKSGLECDIIIALNDGRWGAIEVKMGSKEIESAAEHLIEFSQKIDTSKMQSPSFLMVITAGEVAFKRKDGVLIVPIGCLKP